MASQIVRPEPKIRAALLYSNLHIGLIAVCFTLGTSAILNVPPSLPLLVLACCGAFAAYQLERGLDLAPEDAFNHPDRLAWIARHPRYFRLSVGVAVVLGASMLPLLRPATVAICVVLGVLSALYMLPLRPGGHRLKAIWYLKPLLISTGWAIGGVVLPVIEAGAPVSQVVAGVVAYRFLFVLPNTLLADWPDRKGDRLAGLKTAATLFPSAVLRRAALACLMVSLTAGILSFYVADVPYPLYADLAGPLLLLGCVWQPFSETRWLYSFGIDLVVAWPGFTALIWWLG